MWIKIWEELHEPNVRLRRCTCVHCTGYGASAVYSSSLVSCPFCVWSAAESHVGGKHSPPLPCYTPTAVSAPGRMVGEVGGLVLTETAAQVLCWVSCRTAPCPFRACLSATLETQRAVCAGVRVCTAQDMVQVRCTAAVSCHVLFVYGALRRVTLAESIRLPTLRRDPRSRAHHTVYRPPDALVQRRSRALRPYPPRILWARVVPGVSLPSRASPEGINPPAL